MSTEPSWGTGPEGSRRLEERRSKLLESCGAEPSVPRTNRTRGPVPQLEPYFLPLEIVLFLRTTDFGSATTACTPPLREIVRNVPAVKEVFLRWLSRMVVARRS